MRVIVIGYGNELFSDDGIGQLVAKALDKSNIKSVAVHQLTPELATVLANSDLAIFIDACINSPDYQVQVQSISPVSSLPVIGHISDPRSLLALTQAVYHYCPLAWWIQIPGVNFEIGGNLSQIAATGMAIAREKIMQIIAENFSSVKGE